MYPIPDKGEVILLEDNSTIEPLYGSEISALSDVNRAASRINVNKSYSIRIQDQGGSCVSSAKVTVTGAYTYNNGKNIKCKFKCSNYICAYIMDCFY